MIQLYGTAEGNGSWARVTAGIRRGLEAHGKLAGFFDVERVDYADAQSMQDGCDAEVGLCVGAPPSAPVMVGRGNHRHRMLMIATNSSWLPDVIMERAARICTEFVAPSRWSAKIIEDYARGRPVLVFPHGVEPGFVPTERPTGAFRALHLASTHMERKGTRELIHGWALALQQDALPEGSTLRLVIDGPRGMFNHTIFEATGGDPKIADSYRLSQRLDLKVEDMAALYRDHHLVVQPSRSEGFGMVPLEARACGVPVVMTTCTGHAEHVDSRGVARVIHGAEAPVDDGPGAKAPTITAEAVASALAGAADNIGLLQAEALEAAPQVRERWSWEAVTERFLSENQGILGA